jgi:hypothetical protein
MSKRLQVVMEVPEWEEIRRAAERHGKTVSEWVRGALRESRGLPVGRPAEEKLATIRAAARHEGPTADIDQVLAEIEAGYGEASE